jgi:hypothetical protein
MASAETVISIPGMDKHIEHLMGCKPIPEVEVKKLCEMGKHPSFVDQGHYFFPTKW